MPRKSVENISAAAFRAAKTKRAAPAHLTKRAKELWNDIVSDRPADFFRPGSWELLTRYCVLSDKQERVEIDLAPLGPRDDGFIDLMKVAESNAKTLMLLAMRTRLTVQWSVARTDDGKLDEKGSRADANELLGGLRVIDGGKRPTAKTNKRA